MNVEGIRSLKERQRWQTKVRVLFFFIFHIPVPVSYPRSLEFHFDTPVSLTNFLLATPGLLNVNVAEIKTPEFLCKSAKISSIRELSTAQRFYTLRN